MADLSNEDYDQMDMLDMSRAEYEAKGLVGKAPKVAEVSKPKEEPKKKVKK